MATRVLLAEVDQRWEILTVLSGPQGGPVLAPLLPERHADRDFAPGRVIGGRRLTGLYSNPARPISRAVCASFDGGDGLFTADACLIATGDQISGRTLIAICGDPADNAHGEIAFWAAFTGGHGIFTRRRLVAALGDTIDGLRLTAVFGDPALSESGVVVFRAAFAGAKGLFTPNRCLLTTGESLGGERITELAWPAVDDSGDVTVLASLTNGEHALLRAKSAVPRLGSPRRNVRRLDPAGVQYAFRSRREVQELNVSG